MYSYDVATEYRLPAERNLCYPVLAGQVPVASRTSSCSRHMGISQCPTPASPWPVLACYKVGFDASTHLQLTILPIPTSICCSSSLCTCELHCDLPESWPLIEIVTSSTPVLV